MTVPMAIGPLDLDAAGVLPKLYVRVLHIWKIPVSPFGDRVSFWPSKPARQKSREPIWAPCSCNPQ